MTDKRAKRIAKFIEPLRVEPGTKVSLERDFDPGYKAKFLKKKDGEQLLRQGVEVLSEYQDRLAAQDTYGVLVVLQALDAAGKDGTIRHVMSGVNPQGVSVHSFKVPSTEELDHDYLWRFAKNLPARGDIAIFNRSYYEEVLVVRVHPELLERQKLPKAMRTKKIWNKRFHEINEWERHLVDNGFKVVKLFLNLSNEEQRVRFLRRIDLPEKNWKFSAADARERSYWDDYQKAFSEMLSRTSTEWAPWYVIPADHKWFARICAVAVIGNAMFDIDPKYPVLDQEARDGLAGVKAELMAAAPEGAEADPFAAELEAKSQADDRADGDDHAAGDDQADAGNDTGSDDDAGGDNEAESTGDEAEDPDGSDEDGSGDGEEASGDSDTEAALAALAADGSRDEASGEG